jgi:hypothetical protein
LRWPSDRRLGGRASRAWAEWIAWTLEEVRYKVEVQAWDFRPGGNFVLVMQRAAAEAELLGRGGRNDSSRRAFPGNRDDIWGISGPVPGE